MNPESIMDHFLDLGSGPWILRFWTINTVNTPRFLELSVQSSMFYYGAVFLANVFPELLSGGDLFVSTFSEIMLVIGKGRISLPA